jgi:hypothetical protein
MSVLAVLVVLRRFKRRNSREPKSRLRIVRGATPKLSCSRFSVTRRGACSIGRPAGRYGLNRGCASCCAGAVRRQASSARAERRRFAAAIVSGRESLGPTCGGAFSGTVDCPGLARPGGGCTHPSFARRRGCRLIIQSPPLPGITEHDGECVSPCFQILLCHARSCSSSA